MGNFNFPLNSNEPLYWNPPQCPGIAMHRSAEVKPYLNVLQFLTPPPGTGTITFRALVKFDHANLGEFYYPNLAGDLSLSEGPSLTDRWVAGTRGADCSSTCKGPVDSAAIASASDPRIFAASVEISQSCAQPVLSTCAVNIAQPYLLDSGVCLRPEGAIACAQEPWRNSSPIDKSAGVPLCKCNSTATPSSQPSAGGLRISGASSSRAGLALFGSVGLVAVAASSPRWLGLGLMLLLSVPPALSHNWLHVNSRATAYYASTTSPCPSRKSTDLHVQVGINQSFVIGWDSGHEVFSYLVILSGADEEHLSDANFVQQVEAYIAQAPTSSNLALQPAYQRVHGCSSTSTAVTQTSLGFFEGPINSTDPLFHYHPALGGSQYKYNTSLLAQWGDAYVSYRNANFSWIQVPFFLIGPSIFFFFFFFN